MAVTQSPNMNLQIPSVGTEPGPDYAQDINNDLTIIDQHDHTLGNGVQIQPGGLNINSDLSIQNNNLFLARSVRFNPQLAVITNPTDIGCLYVVGNELFYNDVTGGNHVQITNNGSVDAGAGSISGLPSGTAGVNYSAGAFTFSEATNTPANLVGGSISIGDNIAASKYVTLSAPTALAANYTLNLPTTSPPYGFSIFISDASGNMGYSSLDGTTLNTTGGIIEVKPLGITAAQIANQTITAAKIANNTITRNQLAAVGQQISLSSGDFTTSSTSFTAVTGLTVTITTTGRPVMLMTQSDGLGVTSFTGLTTPGGVTRNANFSFFRGAGQISISTVNVDANSTAILTNAEVIFLDIPTAGTYTYTLRINVDNGDSTAHVKGKRLVAYEL